MEGSDLRLFREAAAAARWTRGEFKRDACSAGRRGPTTIEKVLPTGSSIPGIYLKAARPGIDPLHMPPEASVGIGAGIVEGARRRLRISFAFGRGWSRRFEGRSPLQFTLQSELRLTVTRRRRRETPSPLAPCKGRKRRGTATIINPEHLI